MSVEVLLLYVVLYALCSVREEDNVVIADEIVLQRRNAISKMKACSSPCAVVMT